MQRYVCDIVGTGTDTDPYRPAVADSTEAQWRATDGRANARARAGIMLVEVEDDTVHVGVGIELFALASLTRLGVPPIVGETLDAAWGRAQQRMRDTAAGR